MLNDRKDFDERKSKIRTLDTLNRTSELLKGRKNKSKPNGTVLSNVKTGYITLNGTQLIFLFAWSGFANCINCTWFHTRLIDLSSKILFYHLQCLMWLFYFFFCSVYRTENGRNRREVGLHDVCSLFFYMGQRHSIFPKQKQHENFQVRGTDAKKKNQQSYVFLNSGFYRLYQQLVQVQRYSLEASNQLLRTCCL